LLIDHQVRDHETQHSNNNQHGSQLLQTLVGHFHIMSMLGNVLFGGSVRWDIRQMVNKGKQNKQA
jgi:hypothetical protein